MSNAPICIIQPTISKEQPAPVKWPSIPTATDLPSTLNAINSIAAWIRAAQQILDQLAQQGGLAGFSTKGGAQQGRWNQLSRQTQQVKITNPQDPTQYVVIDRINSLTMQDNRTGETWVWNR